MEHVGDDLVTTAAAVVVPVDAVECVSAIDVSVVTIVAVVVPVCTVVRVSTGNQD